MQEIINFTEVRLSRFIQEVMLFDKIDPSVCSLREFASNTMRTADQDETIDLDK